jgi:predicted nucleotidyltransferase component of viral defense system
MIADREIEQKAAEFALTPINVEKDYVYGWLLNAIYDRPQLASRLVLKGGQALRKAYLPDTRFSKDLDFSALEHLDPDFLERELREACARVTAATGVRFLDHILMKDKELPIEGVDALEVRLYFKGFYGEENLSLRAQLDVTQFEKIYLPVQSRTLLHAYSDAHDCAAMIRVQKLEEILASKLTALLHRRKPVDLYDLLYAILIAQNYPVARFEVVSTFLKKSIFEPQPQLAKEQLLAIPLGAFEGIWPSLLVPAAALMAFSFVTSNFHSLVEALFTLVVPAAVPPSFARPLGRPLGRPTGRPLGGPLGRMGGMPRAFQGLAGVSPLRANTRQTLVTAAHNGHMIEMGYDGYTRLVEPYKLEYYVRKSDGVGSEYFWGWDTSGGKSGRIGIKKFFCHKIVAATESNQPYAPRYPVQL